MLCLPLKPIIYGGNIAVDCTHPDTVAVSLWNNICEDGGTSTDASVCVAGSIAVDVIHDLACEIYADDLLDVEVWIEDSGYDDGVTWVNFEILGKVNADGRAELADQQAMDDDIYAYHGVKRSDFM